MKFVIFFLAALQVALALPVLESSLGPDNMIELHRRQCYRVRSMPECGCGKHSEVEAHP